MNRLEMAITEAKQQLQEKPLMATSVERILILDELKSQYRELPQPKRFSRFLTELLNRVSVPLEAHDLIAGRCVDRELTEAEEGLFQAYKRHPDYVQKEVFLSSGHCTYSWEMLVEEGIPGLRARIEKALQELKAESDSAEDQVIFYEAMLEIYDGLEAYMLRYASAARDRGMEKLSSILTEAATERPKHFCAALQLLWIITLVDCAYITPNPTLTVGRLDQILYPLYERDIQEGVLTREEAAWYITDYYCKHNLIMGRGEHQVGDEANSTTFERICCFDAPQYLLLAGTDREGKPAVNDLTVLFARCIQPSFKNPVVVVRYFQGMNEQYPELWSVLMEKALQSSSLMFYNDDNILSVFRRMGIPEEDYRQYAHFGCNWPSVGDRSAWMQGGPHSSKYHVYLDECERDELCIPYMRTNTTHSWPEDFVLILQELADKEAVTMEDFYARFFERMEDFIERKLQYLAKELQVRKRKPSAVLTFGDCFFRDSLANGTCFSADAKYHFELQAFQMFGTVADCFIVTDMLVFQEKRLTLKALANAVRDQFAGHERVLAMCRNVQKYGSDTELSNMHARRLAKTATDLILEKNRFYYENMGLFLVPCMQSDTWHLKMGADYGATPDGRLPHTSFSQNARPSNGACTGGITAMLNSMLSVPSDSLLSGALNLDVDPGQFEGEEGRARFGALLGTYLNRGGLHAQVSSVSLKDLLDARIHPELHRDLRVRVTGYSGVFVDICEKMQDDIIARFQ